MTQTLTVEYQELMARAEELDRPIRRVPSVNPQAPCRLAFVDDTAVQLALSADAMRLYLQAAEREWKKLARSLRNAAKAYETVDEGSSADIDSIGFDGSGAASKTGGGDQMSAMCDPDEDFGGYVPPPPPPAPPPFQFPYYEVRTAATLIVTGDAGAAYKQFAAEWDSFQRDFQADTTYRFRPFTAWEGASQIAVEQNFNSQRQWIYSMSASCVTLSQQALRVADAHKKAAVHGQHRTWNQGNPTAPAEHPTTYEVSQCDYWYQFYTQRNSPYLYTAIEWYEELQASSETSLSLYVTNGSIPLSPVVPSAPITAYPIAEPVPKPDPQNPDDPDNPGGEIPTPEFPSGGGESPGEEDPFGDYLNDPSLTESSMMPSTGLGGMPSMPSAQNDPKLTEALNRLGKAPVGVKPAGVGAGGAGGAGVPKMPLADAPGAGGAAGAASGKPLIGGAIPGVRGSGGATGGGMPMGGAPGGQSKDGKQGKRIASSEDEALYTEDRQWTGSVIGHRRAKDDLADQ